MITINAPHLTTRMEIWAPRYSSAYTETGERVALLAKYKVDKSTPIIRVEFTKAKHLVGQRFAIARDKVWKCPIDTNGKIPCYAVPMSEFDSWQTYEESNQIEDIIYD
jgi:hypothetical protein